MNFAHRKNLFSIFFESFIHFPGNKTFTGKGKEKGNGSNCYRLRPKTAKAARSIAAVRGLATAQSAAAARCAPAPPRPGRNLGLGQECPSPPGLKAAQAMPTVGSHQTAPRGIRWNKKSVAASSPQTLIIRLPLFLSQPRSAESESRERTAMAPSPAPRRHARSPTGERAVVEWPSSGALLRP